MSVSAGLGRLLLEVIKCGWPSRLTSTGLQTMLGRTEFFCPHSEVTSWHWWSAWDSLCIARGASCVLTLSRPHSCHGRNRFMPGVRSQRQGRRSLSQDCSAGTWIQHPELSESSCFMTFPWKERWGHVFSEHCTEEASALQCSSTSSHIVLLWIRAALVGN